MRITEKFSDGYHRVVGRGQVSLFGNGTWRTLHKQLVNKPSETEALGRRTGNSQTFKRQGLHWATDRIKSSE